MAFPQHAQDIIHASFSLTAGYKLGKSHQSISQRSNRYSTDSICYWYSKVDGSYNAHTEVKLQFGRKAMVPTITRWQGLVSFLGSPLCPDEN